MKPTDFTYADRRQPPGPPAACASCGGLQEATADGVQCMRCLFALALGGDEAGLAEDFSWQFGDFTVSRHEDGRHWELGHGAMGVTYRAQDTLLDRPVALKIVRASVPDHASQRTRFLHEARRAAALRHPNVASIHQYGVREADGQPFYAMELVEGETLEERVGRTGPLPAASVLGIGLQIALALQAAEKRGVIHRDLKPSNVMLVQDHEDGMGAFVKVIDFGLAQVASAVAGADHGQASEGKPTSFAGTPAYASPEQLAGGVTLDSRTDFYALGATLWFLLSGHSLYGRLAFDEIIRQQTNVRLPFARLPGAPGEKQILGRLLGRLLEPDRSRRPQSGDELIALLQRAQQALARRKTRRQRVGWTLLAAAFVASLLAFGWHFARGQKWAQPSPGSATLAVTVLPFADAAGDHADASLGVGLQQEVAATLARCPELSVVSPRNADRHPAGKSDQEAAQEIGAKLAVAYAVEGSIRRDSSTGRLRVQVDLIDTRVGTRSWSATYERSSADLFALRNEIATAVTRHVGLTGATPRGAAEDSAYAPDPVAYEMYVRARAEANPNLDESQEQYRRILHWLHEATARDPGFARAYAEAAYWEALIYLYRYDASPAQAERVRAAAEAATRLGADTAQAHDAQGVYQYYVRSDYEQARQQFAAALRVMPDDARALFFLGLAERRLGHWESALEHFRQAETLDPLNADVSRKVVAVLACLHRYGEIAPEIDAWRQRDPHGVLHLAFLLDLQSEGRADTKLLHQAIALLPATREKNNYEAEERYWTALLDHDPAEALRVATQLGGPMAFQLGGRTWPESLLTGQALRLLGDTDAARRKLLAARAELERGVPNNPDPLASAMLLARVDALLGRREEASREGRAVLTQCAAKQDRYEGAVLAVWGAANLALVGDKQAALDLLLAPSTRPGLNYRDLSLHPDWDALRGDGRFEALRLSLAPKP